MNDVRKLGLGTVQWGLTYGVSNRAGQTPREEVNAILTEARSIGIQVLDTASLYGEAEEIVGKNSLDTFRIITKTPKFACPIITQKMADELRNVFFESLRRLSCKQIYGLLIHHADDLLTSGGDTLVQVLKNLKTRGLVQKIGISVYDGQQIDRILTFFKPDIVQLPLSVLDQRLLKSGHIGKLKSYGTEIHVRSVFLQGLLLMPLNQISFYFDPIRNLLKKWHDAAKQQGMTLTQAALSFVRDIPEVDTVLVGVNNLAQFRTCVQDFSVDGSFDALALACDNPAFVNPVNWKDS